MSSFDKSFRPNRPGIRHISFTSSASADRKQNKLTKTIQYSSKTTHNKRVSRFLGCIRNCQADHFIEINYNLTHPHFKPKDGARPNPGEHNKAFRDRVSHYWVLRKMSISARDRSFILIQPSKEFKQKLKLSWESEKSRGNYSAMSVHLIAIEAANRDWIRYLDTLEIQLNKFIWNSGSITKDSC